MDLPSTFPTNRYQNSVRLLILRLEKDKKLSKFSAAITKLLQEDIRPEHEFAVGVIAAAGHDSEVVETVAPAVWGEMWDIRHVRDLRAASEVITRCKQPDYLRIILDTDMTAADQGNLRRVLAGAKTHFKGELYLICSYSLDNFKAVDSDVIEDVTSAE